MKNRIAFLSIAIIAAAIVSFTTPHIDGVPQEVKTAFKQKFPMAKKVTWEKESESEWEAEFKMNKTEYSVNFSLDGKWIETEHEISKKEIPQYIKDTLNKDFSGYKIEEAEISETVYATIYEIEIEKGEESWEIAIDKNGKVVKKEKLEEEED